MFDGLVELLARARTEREINSETLGSVAKTMDVFFFALCKF